MVKISSFRLTLQESGVSVGFNDVVERDGGMVVIGKQPGSCLARPVSASSRVMQVTRVMPVSLRIVLTRFPGTSCYGSSCFFEPNG